MKTTIAWATALGLGASLLAAGCILDRMPPPTHVGWSTLTVLSVNPDDAKEMEGATAVEKARLNYLYRLEVLRDYYNHIGYCDKYEASVREVESVRKAQWFRWDGLPEIEPPAGESIKDADERMLVEYAFAARAAYKKALGALLEQYQLLANEMKAKTIQRVLERLDAVRENPGFYEAEIPPADLKPVEVIPDADALYEKALKLHREGKIFPLAPDYAKQRRALATFKELITQYPRSTKIAFSAYYIGDILKEYFNENLRAVRWFERAWQWDPTITQPARFQAAVVWDLRLKEPDKALEIYKGVVEHEQFNQSNVNYAYKRIEEILKEKQQRVE